ncbi:hypothetical protein BT63DRAFT_478055 [Microthyrium microscopicum]|uniref:Uncharacterized protein n=1 Tax=Microthyrium microscopicum TaxID=703497 RepID=A0A6A6UE36_9PEZI|nr:hypothetical protein BT63DRAFT_478055 [Microthyrium microscopicum]
MAENPRANDELDAAMAKLHLEDQGRQTANQNIRSSMQFTSFSGHSNMGVQVGQNSGNIEHHHHAAPGERWRFTIPYFEKFAYCMNTEPPEQPPKCGMFIPFPRSDFVGRLDIMKELDSRCSQSGHWTALAGLGGQIAIEYCYRLRKSSPSTWVFWIHASNETRFEQSLQDIANYLKLPGRKSPATNYYQLFEDWLRDDNQGSWFVVLDNANDEKFLMKGVKPKQHQDLGTGRGSASTPAPTKRLRDFLPFTQRGSVLVTTRSRHAAIQLAGFQRLIAVGVMDNGEATRLLQQKLGSQYTKQDFSKLAEYLEYIPLAMILAAAYISRRENRCSVNEYLENFKSSDGQKMELLADEGEYQPRDREAVNCIFRTWSITLNTIRKAHDSAFHLLSSIGFFDPQGIPDSLMFVPFAFQEIANVKELTGGPPRPDVFKALDAADPKYLVNARKRFESALQVLRDYSLITATTDPGVFEMHRLIRLAVQEELKKSNLFYKAYHRNVDSLHWKYFQSSFELGKQYEDIKLWSSLFPHFKILTEIQPNATRYLYLWLHILQCTAYLAFLRGRIFDAKALALVGYQACTASQAFGSESLEAARFQRQIGQCYADEFQYLEAEKQYQASQSKISSLLQGMDICSDQGQHLLATWMDIMYNLAIMQNGQRKLQEAENTLSDASVLGSKLSEKYRYVVLKNADALVHCYASQEGLVPLPLGDDSSGLGYVVTEHDTNDDTSVSVAKLLAETTYLESVKLLGRNDPRTMRRRWMRDFLSGEPAKHQKLAKDARGLLARLEKHSTKDHVEIPDTMHFLATLLKESRQDGPALEVMEECVPQAYISIRFSRIVIIVAEPLTFDDELVSAMRKMIFGDNPGVRATPQDSGSNRHYQYASFTGASNRGIQIGYNVGNIESHIHHAAEHPEITPEPDIFINFERDVDFVGRSEILKNLEEKCVVPGSWTVLAGLGGVGALLQAPRIDTGHLDFWIRASNEARYDQSLRDIAEKLKLSGRQDPIANFAKLFHDWLQNNNRKWFVVLNNADDAGFLINSSQSSQSSQPGAGDSASIPPNSKPLREYLPRPQHGSYLATTRSKRAARQLTKVRKIIPVDLMDEEEACRLLQTRLEDEQPKIDLLNLMRALECIPLAIVMAGAYISKRAPRCSARQFLNTFEKNDKQKVSLLSNDGGYQARDYQAQNCVFTTWNITMLHIFNTNKPAANLFYATSFFDRQGIPDDLLRSVFMWIQSSKKAIDSSEQEAEENSDNNALAYFQRPESSSSMDEAFENAFQMLRDYWLVTVTADPSVFEVHRLIQVGARQLNLTSNDFYGNLLVGLAVIYFDFEDGKPVSGSHSLGQDIESKKWRVYFPHFKALISSEPQLDEYKGVWLLILSNTAEAAVFAGKYSEAESIASVLLQRCSPDTWKATSPTTLIWKRETFMRINVVLGKSYAARLMYSQCEIFLDRFLPTMFKEFNIWSNEIEPSPSELPNLFLYVDILWTLAMVKLCQNKLQQGQKWLDRAYETICYFTMQHPSVEDRFKRRTLDITEALIINVIRITANREMIRNEKLAELPEAVEEVRNLASQNYDRSVALLGADDVRTTRRRWNCLFLAGTSEAHESLVKEGQGAREKLEASLGSDHSAIPEALWFLATLLKLVDKHAEALEVMEECVRLGAQIRGSDNCRTQECARRLSNWKQNIPGVPAIGLFMASFP